MSDESIEAQVARIDERTENLARQFAVLGSHLSRQDEKLDRLITAFDMGRGGAVLVAKLGGILLLFVGALAWVIDHWHGWFK